MSSDDSRCPLPTVAGAPAAAATGARAEGVAVVSTPSEMEGASLHDTERSMGTISGGGTWSWAWVSWLSARGKRATAHFKFSPLPFFFPSALAVVYLFQSIFLLRCHSLTSQRSEQRSRDREWFTSGSDCGGRGAPEALGYADGVRGGRSSRGGGGGGQECERLEPTDSHIIIIAPLHLFALVADKLGGAPC